MPLNIDWHQILLHLFNFVLLFAILYFLLYRPIKNFMESRDEHYKKIDAEASEKLSGAEDAKAQYEELLHNAREEIKAERADALHEIQALREAKIREAQAKADEIISESHKKAQAERDRILSDAEAQIPDMVSLAVEKLSINTQDSFDSFLSAAERSDKNE